MSDLDETTNQFIRTPSKVGDYIQLADKYMQTYKENPNMFVLPKPHSFMQPLVAAYAADPEGSIAYLIALRDNFSKSESAWEAIQKQYRRINGRYVQQQRRERAGRAAAKAEELYGPTDYHSRLQWVADLEHGWANRRLSFMDQHRGKSKQSRIDTETRAELLQEFWELIDNEIKEGKEIPPWN